MKFLILLVFIFSTTQVLFGQQKEFIDFVLDDFDCRECTFVALDIVSHNFVGKAVIENDDLYSYFEKTKGFDKFQYKEHVKSLLKHDQALQIKTASLDESGDFIEVQNAPKQAFVVVKKYKDVDEVAARGCQTFIRYYFLGEKLDAIKDSSMTCHEFIRSIKEPLRLGAGKGFRDKLKQAAITEKLFDWQIAVGIQDISHELLIVDWR